MFDFRRTHTCGALNKTHIGQQVTLSGWVHRRRDHGGLIFIDLRDRYGITQLLFDPAVNPSVHTKASDLRSEWVISIRGEVIARKEGMANSNLSTGDIEIQVQDLEILSQAKTPPFSICDEEVLVNEELRLKYRYLDIRRGMIAKNLVMRHNVMLSVRKFLDSQGFLEITTPILSKSTPEGARDYLVPSRIYPGNFYALPQSPQIFKQILMVAGMDKYFQIATCFRDEDLRADRQPEFSQIDMEMSFQTPETIFAIVEKLAATIFKECIHRDVSLPIRRVSHKECLEKYGTDKPDLRFDMAFTRFDSLAKRASFSIFHEQLDQGGIVKGFVVKQGASYSRRELDNFSSFVEKFGLSGLCWMKKTEEGLTSPIAKFFSSELLVEIEKLYQLEKGDLLILGAEKEARLNQAFDHLRRHIAREKNLIDKNLLCFLWVTDFPMFSWDAENKKIQSEHHPFTSCHFDDIHLLEKEPLKARAFAYDLVLNGCELASGSQRIHDSNVQKKVFELLELTEEEIQVKFGYFLEALKYGTPPHLGLALGLDRIVMLLSGTENLRDVMAFPKTQKASDLMMQTPSSVSKEQLKELHNMPTEYEQIVWE
jgi:aspartyl-tRNA synthetase